MKKIYGVIVLVILGYVGVAQSQSLDDVNELTLEDIMNLGVVTGASKYEQKVSEAPADVTLITAEDIRLGGFRTLYEVMNAVPGIYMRDDRNYNFIGVRGLNRPGDYNARILVTINGHRMNENIYDSVGYKEDGPIALSLIDRIEVIRGPASSLYGNNAFFGVINIVTKDSTKLKGFESHASYGSFEAKRATVNYGKSFGGGNGLIFGVEGVDITGPELRMQGLGKVDKGMDFEETARGFASFNHGNFDLQSSFNSRAKGIPTASYDSMFNVENTTRDQRFYLDTGYKFNFNNNQNLSARLHYDDYLYHAAGSYDYPPVTINRDEARGQWWGVDLKFANKLNESNRVILGVDYTQSMRQNTQNFDEDPYALILDKSSKPKSWAVYIQDELKLNPKLTFNGSLRYDKVQNIKIDSLEVEHDNVAPRAAFIYALDSKTTAKFIVGSAFRAPNQDEMNNLNPDIRPERINSAEVLMNSSFTSNLNVGLSVSYYKIDGLISSSGTWPSTMYYNTDVNASALAAELNFKLSKRLSGRLAYSYQNVELSDSGDELTNSPKGVGKVNLSSKLSDRVSLSTDIQYLSDTKDAYGVTVDGYVVANIALTGRDVFSKQGLDLSLRAANVLDQEYYAPADNISTSVPEAVEQDHINAELKVSYRF